jgi:hypothetical protein
MSGGSMDYLYQRVRDANFSLHTPERLALRVHLLKLADVLRKVEWVDSGDSGPEQEADMIRECLAPTAVLESLVKQAEKIQDALHAEIARAGKGDA